MFMSRRMAAGFAAVGVAGIMLGALLWGNLFTIMTGEFNGVGPGFATGKTSLKADTTVVITTSCPENYASFKLASWIETAIWRLTGRMTPSADGRWDIVWSHHAGVTTNDGLDWVEDQLWDSPSTTPAIYISLSSTTHVPVAGDHRLWAEIDTGGGLDRVGGTYASTGVGTATVSKTFTADNTYTNVQATGLHWSDTDSSNSTMLFGDTFAPASPIASDTITVTWTVSDS